MEPVVVSLTVCNILLTVTVCALSSCILPLWAKVVSLEGKLGSVDRLKADVEKLDEVVDNIVTMAGLSERK